MALNVPPALRARIDQQVAEYSRHVDELLAAADLLESTATADRVAILNTAITLGLTGTTEEQLAKATALAATALERLSRKETAS
jgi:hypothetical protein